jgi:hypothetical protein
MPTLQYSWRATLRKIGARSIRGAGLPLSVRDQKWRNTMPNMAFPANRLASSGRCSSHNVFRKGSMSVRLGFVAHWNRKSSVRGWEGSIVRWRTILLSSLHKMKAHLAQSGKALICMGNAGYLPHEHLHKQILNLKSTLGGCYPSSNFSCILNPTPLANNPSLASSIKRLTLKPRRIIQVP